MRVITPATSRTTRRVSNVGNNNQRKPMKRTMYVVPVIYPDGETALFTVEASNKKKALQAVIGLVDKGGDKPTVGLPQGAREFSTLVEEITSARPDFIVK